jgi:hypothetical protein
MTIVRFIGVCWSLREDPRSGSTKQSSWIATPGFAGLAMTE